MLPFPSLFYPQPAYRSLQVYFDKTRNRTDPFVSVNALALFHSRGRSEHPALIPTHAHVLSILRTRAYEAGTRYYLVPEFFLFFLSRLLRYSSSPTEFSKEIKPLLLECTLERLTSTPSTGIAHALRAIILLQLDRPREARSEVVKLLALQNEDGSWGVDWVYRYGRNGIRIGSKGFCTAMAVQAVREMLKREDKLKNVATKGGVV